MRKRILVLASIFTVFGLSPAAQGQFLDSITKQSLIQAGHEIFVNRCSGCHGLSGNGEGPAASFLNPKPRDLTKGVFKLKTAPNGVLPTDADLMKVLDQGIPGSSMPSFKLMSESQKMAVISYIKTLAPEAWQKQTLDAPVVSLKLPVGVFTRKQEFLSYAANGRVWFQELGCVSCHGNSGKGDGPAANALNDMWNQPILPANLNRDTLKRGATIQDVALSVALGVDGTPMPGYLDSVPEEKVIWEIAAYIFYLRGRANGFYPDEPIKAIPETRIPPEEVNAVIGKYMP